MQPTPPCSAPICWWQLWALGVAIRHVICGFYLFIYFSSRLCCPLEIPKLPTDPPVRGFPGVWKLLPFLGWISVPNSFVSLFIFYILSYLLLKTMGCLSGCLMSSSSIQKLFCGIFSAFKCSFDEFVREKVVPVSYSSAILGPPLKNLVYVGHWPRAVAASVCHQPFMHF